MRIVFHLGVHCTDEERLVRCLLKNRGILAEQGIIVPAPSRYRILLRNALEELRGAPASRETQALILDQIMDEAEADRLVLSWDSFLAFPSYAIRGALYPAAGKRMLGFTQIFPDIETEFHLAMRNPATLLPAIQQLAGPKAAKEMVDGLDPLTLRWSDTVRRILAQNPGVPLTVWCDEETPLIWPEVLQSVSGHASGTNLIDTDELLGAIMNDIGMSRMKAYCIEHPPKSVAQRRRIVAAFLEKFARTEKVMVDVAVPGWDDSLVAEITRLYLEDVERIRRMPGVSLIEA